MLKSESVKTVSNAAPTNRIGAIIGTMIFRKRCRKVAPSTFAASMISGFTEVIPASRTMALNGKLRQTLTNITEASASSGCPSHTGQPGLEGGGDVLQADEPGDRRADRSVAQSQVKREEERRAHQDTDVEHGRGEQRVAEEVTASGRGAPPGQRLRPTAHRHRERSPGRRAAGEPRHPVTWPCAWRRSAGSPPRPTSRSRRCSSRAPRA